MYNAPPFHLPHGLKLKSNTGKTLCLGGAALIAALAFGQAVDPGTVADIAERTAPFGKLCLEGDDCAGGQAALPASAAAMSGGDVYGRFCRTCHDTGLNDAPKVGDAEAWAPRLAKGNETLLANTKEGFNNGLMPAMGLCMSCSDAELQAAIDFMAADAQP